MGVTNRRYPGASWNIVETLQQGQCLKEVAGSLYFLIGEEQVELDSPGMTYYCLRPSVFMCV